MTRDDFKKMSEKDLKTYIRGKLEFDHSVIGQMRYRVDDNEGSEKSFYKALENQHRRFEMGGLYGLKQNFDILYVFADDGIFDYTSFLYLDFYKGQPTLYLRYFWKNEDIKEVYEGFTTTEIIYEIFKLTVLSEERIRQDSIQQ